MLGDIVTAGDFVIGCVQSQQGATTGRTMGAV